MRRQAMLFFFFFSEEDPMKIAKCVSICFSGRSRKEPNIDR